jgi:hypothetical protein
MLLELRALIYDSKYLKRKWKEIYTEYQARFFLKHKVHYKKYASYMEEKTFTSLYAYTNIHNRNVMFIQLTISQTIRAI